MVLSTLRGWAVGHWAESFLGLSVRAGVVQMQLKAPGFAFLDSTRGTWWFCGTRLGLAHAQVTLTPSFVSG